MPGAKLSSDPAVPYSTTKPARLQIESRAGTPHQSRCARQSDPTPQPAGGPCEPATHEILCRPPGQALSLRAPRDAVRATTWIVGSVRGKAGCTFSPFRDPNTYYSSLSIILLDRLLGAIARNSVVSSSFSSSSSTVPSSPPRPLPRTKSSQRSFSWKI